MSRISYLLAGAALTATIASETTLAQQPAAPAAKPPLYAATKVDGTDNVPFVLRRYCGLWGRGT